MNLNKLKEYLQNYLNEVIIPHANKTLESDGIEPIISEIEVFQVLKGSYQPPIYHIFLDVEPHDILKTSLKKVEEGVDGFMKIFYPFKTKIHWNKRPIFKNNQIV